MRIPYVRRGQAGGFVLETRLSCPDRRATNRPKKHTLLHVRDAPGVRARQRERRAATPRSHDLP